ncbi:MAG: zinc ribbon domain-containing protein [Bryobacteraceae bacterium]|nr:zinc ribbon domain-containing protein [Bryobacteraceae bacterium]
MPMYEYRCPECDRRFEKLRRMSEAEQPAECPQCASRTAERQLSGFAAVSVGGSAGGGAEMQMGGGCARPGCGPGGCGGAWKN